MDYADVDWKDVGRTMGKLGPTQASNRFRKLSRGVEGKGLLTLSTMCDRLRTSMRARAELDAVRAKTIGHTRRQRAGRQPRTKTECRGKGNGTVDTAHASHAPMHHVVLDDDDDDENEGDGVWDRDMGRDGGRTGMEEEEEEEENDGELGHAAETSAWSGMSEFTSLYDRLLAELRMEEEGDADALDALEEPLDGR